MKNKIVFMGSPDFAVPSLIKLYEYYSVVGVITQPDRPAGRGRTLTPPSVKITADQLGIPTIQPSRLHLNLEAKDILRKWRPDIIVVAAYGQILKKDILKLPRLGCINIHASLLPRWRGVSPIQACILHGDSITGVTIMEMDEGIDTGNIISQQSIPIKPEDTGGSLFKKLSLLGSELLINTLPGYLKQEIITQPQGDSPTPYTKMLKRSDGKLDFNLSAEFLTRQVRAYNPWPGTFMAFKGINLIIHKTKAILSSSPGIGIRTKYENCPAIGTSDGLLVLLEIQPAGKRKMQGDDFLRGAKNWIKNS